MKQNTQDCTSGFLGSGLRDCTRSKYGDETGFILMSGLKWDDENPLTKAKYIEAIKGLKAFPYLDNYEFTDNTPENEINTSATGNNSTLRQGKPMWQNVFDKGSYYHKSLYNKRNKRWLVALVFSEGVLLTETIDEEVRGFKSNPFDVETYRLQSGSDIERSIVNIQLSDADEYNARSVFYTWEALGFDIRDVKGYMDVKLEVTVISATELNVKVVSASNDIDYVLGLDDKDLWAMLGTSVTVTDVEMLADDVTYKVTLSGSITGENTIKLANGGFNVVSDLDGNMYKGQETFNASAPSV